MSTISNEYFIKVEKLDLENFVSKPDGRFIKEEDILDTKTPLLNILNSNIFDKNFAQLISIRQQKKEIYSELVGNSVLSNQICGLKFENNFELSEERIENFQCDFCHEKFIKKEQVQNHMKVHQLCVNIRPSTNPNSQKDSEKPFQCKICLKKFKYPSFLIHHEQTHDKKFSCGICHKKYPTETKLIKHQELYHINAKSFSCDVCGKKYNTKGDLKSHKNTHDKSRPKPFNCQKCSYSTHDKRSFEKHRKYHERLEAKYAAMEDPVKCEECGKFYKDEKALIVHQRKSHPARLLQCNFCGKIIKRTADLRKHVEVHLKKMRQN